MLDALKFVKGAVARKDAVAVLTHFRIQHRYIMGYNGLIALGHPLELEPVSYTHLTLPTILRV